MRKVRGIRNMYMEEGGLGKGRLRYRSRAARPVEAVS